MKTNADTHTSLTLLPYPRHLKRATGFNNGSIERSEVDASVTQPQGYRLRIAPGIVEILGHDPAGLFYGAQTLAQLRQQFGDNLPCLTIEDWPDFPARGVMLDISRDKVPTQATLYAMVDLLASLKINQLQLYMEHTFAYRNHKVVWADASPMTPEEIRDLDAYCRERFVELVPNQNSFGHLERWLKHPQYRDLAECPDGAVYWETHHPPATLNPLDPRSIKLIRELHAELLPNFTSLLFNVGCDETFELGMGRSKKACETRGRERVYLDFLLKVYESARSHGRTMQFWGDIILHKPELIHELPKDIIALEWGYEADHPFDRDGALFRGAGVPLYVCPGTSSWLSVAGRTGNALASLRSAAENGRKHGAIGYLNTDWGDQGHFQPLSVSYLPFAAGAALSWCAAAYQEDQLTDALDRLVFQDASGVMGQVAYDLGNVYQAAGVKVRNSSVLGQFLQPDRTQFPAVTREGFNAIEQAIDAAIAPLDSVQLSSPDAALVREEYHHAANLLRYACQRGRRVLGFPSPPPADLNDQLEDVVAEHRRLWLKRNRPGGLIDSAGRMAALKLPV